MFDNSGEATPPWGVQDLFRLTFGDAPFYCCSTTGAFNHIRISLTPTGLRSSWPHRPRAADAESNQNTLSDRHRRPLDSLPLNASEFPSGHHGPIARCGIHSYNPGNPLRISAPRSATSPSGPRDLVSSVCPVAAAFHLLSRSILAAPVAAGTFSASTTARSHPEIV